MLYSSIYGFDRMRSLLEGLLADTRTAGKWGSDFSLTNLYENDGGYMLQFVAPGVKESDVSVGLENNILSVTVKREVEEKQDEKEGVKAIRRERDSLDYTRSYKLSGDADPDKIDAKLVNGLLMVYISKKEDTKPRKIAVAIH